MLISSTTNSPLSQEFPAQENPLWCSIRFYAEGQRRYVETFSPYVRQFMDRMDRPQVDKIEGVPPAIAIDQTNPVRTSRSTVGTMTEINDHLKMLFAQAAVLYCEKCGKESKKTHPNTSTLL